MTTSVLDPPPRPAAEAAPLRVAVVGCGAVAEIHHLPALATVDGLVATVLVDRDGERARRLAARFGVPQVASELAGALDLFDIAIVATPNALHAPLALELLAAGKHVLVEKPMATTLADGDAMVRAAGAARVVLAVGLEFRFFPVAELVKSILDGGLLGPLARFDLRLGVISRWPFATDAFLRREIAGGGVLVDYGSHLLDLLLWWLGDWVDLAYRDDARGGVESDCELELLLRSGVRGTVEISRTRNLRNTCVIEGHLARLEVGLWDPDGALTVRVGGREVDLVGRARATAEAAAAPTMGDCFQRQLEDLRDAVRARRSPRVPGSEGRRSLALTEACYARREPLHLPWEEVPSSDGAAAPAPAPAVAS